MSKNQSKNQPIPQGQGLVSYPNNITDRQVNIKLREMIDHLNATKTAVAANADASTANTKAIADLPTPLSLSDVTMSINNALAPTGAITTAIYNAFKLAGITLPPASRAASEFKRLYVGDGNE